MFEVYLLKFGCCQCDCAVFYLKFGVLFEHFNTNFIYFDRIFLCFSHIFQCYHVYGGSQRGDHNFDTKLSPSQDRNPRDATVGE